MSIRQLSDGLSGPRPVGSASILSGPVSAHCFHPYLQPAHNTSIILIVLKVLWCFFVFFLEGGFVMFRSKLLIGLVSTVMELLVNVDSSYPSNHCCVRGMG